MPEPRLASGIWVSAYLARLGLANIPAYVTARGDETAGAVLVIVMVFRPAGLFGDPAFAPSPPVAGETKAVT